MSQLSDPEEESHGESVIQNDNMLMDMDQVVFKKTKKKTNIIETGQKESGREEKGRQLK